MVDSGPEQPRPQTDVYGGVARLPQSPPGTLGLLTIELEIDGTTQLILAVHLYPEFTALKRLIEEAIIGKTIATIPTDGVQAIMEHYHSPFRNAARAALLQAWEAGTRKAAYIVRDRRRSLAPSYLD